jgi:SAM-dependent methyltransferase
MSFPGIDDFDRCARLLRAEDEDDLYHAFLLRRLPAAIERALEIGCGTGAFSRALARRAEHVTAVDASAEMLRIARERSAFIPNVEWTLADADSFTLEPEVYDVIVSLKTLHHLRGEDFVLRAVRALRPGGTLLLHDVLDSGHGADGLLRDGVAFTIATARRLIRQGRLRERSELREFWAKHAQEDRHPEMPAVRDFAMRLLPGAEVRRHLLWRYTLAWKKPARPQI